MKLLIAKRVRTPYVGMIGQVQQLPDGTQRATLPVGTGQDVIQVEIMDVLAAFEVEEEKP